MLGGGSDTVYFNAMGDAGDDVFRFSHDSGDKVDVGDLLNSLSYLGTAASAFSDGYLSLVASGGNYILRVDSNGSTAGGTVVDMATFHDVVNVRPGVDDLLVNDFV